MSSRWSATESRINKYSKLEYQSYPFYIIVNYTSLLGFSVHFSFAVIFALFKIPYLAVFSIISMAAFAAGHFINLKVCHNAVLYIGYLVVSIYAIVAVLCLGWDSGFHYYILCLVPFVFFSSTIKTPTKIALTAACGIMYLGLNILSNSMEAFFMTNQKILYGFNMLNIIITFIALSFVAYFYNAGAMKAEFSLKKANKKLELLAGTDPLTGLLNRRSMLRKIEHQILQYKVNNKPFALVLTDIDMYKPFNDRYGHECGDYVLISTADIFKNMLRKNDYACRWGGDEFLLLLPETNLDESKIVVEKLRKAISDYKFYYKDHKLNVTMTFGVCIYNGHLDAKEFINKADAALYEGKQMGRNCSIFV